MSARFEYEVIEEKMKAIRARVAAGDETAKGLSAPLYQDWLRAKASNQRLMTAVCRELDK